MADDSFRSKGSDLLKDLADHVATVLATLGDVDPIIAESMGQEVAERMGKAWGGLNIYFPKGMAMENHRIALQIWADFTGNNASELAIKYGISLQWTYKIIKSMRAQDRARRQGDLFPPENGSEP